MKQNNINKVICLWCVLSWLTIGSVSASPFDQPTCSQQAAYTPTSMPGYTMTSVNSNRISSPTFDNTTTMHLPALAISRDNMTAARQTNPIDGYRGGVLKAPPGGGGGGTGTLPNPIGDTPWMLFVLLAIGYGCYKLRKRSA